MLIKIRYPNTVTVMIPLIINEFEKYYFKICFRHLVLLEMISFEIFKTFAQKFAIQCK